MSSDRRNRPSTRFCDDKFAWYQCAQNLYSHYFGHDPKISVVQTWLNAPTIMRPCRFQCAKTIFSPVSYRFFRDKANTWSFDYRTTRLDDIQRGKRIVVNNLLWHTSKYSVYSLPFLFFFSIIQLPVFYDFKKWGYNIITMDLRVDFS